MTTYPVEAGTRPSVLPIECTPSPGPSTRAVHGAAKRTYAHHALTTPIVQTATYTFEDTADLCGFMEARMWGGAKERSEYGRYGNPTVAETEARIAALDNAEDALLFSSGMAAVTLVLLSFMSSGSHLVITNDAYRRTRQFCTQFLKRYHVAATVIQAGDYDAMEAALQPNTRLLISESPTNPYLRVLDLERVADIGRRHGVKTLIDATFATPINQRPIEFGIDLVLHSATKYLGGHNDLLAGAVLGGAELVSAIRDLQGITGAVPDPFSAYLLIRGIKTLALRVARQNENAERIAAFLDAHPKVERVHYPSLPSHPEHAIAKRQMKGFGGVVAFEIRGDLAAGTRLVDACRIPRIAPSLGGVESLIEQPALMSFYELTTEERLQVGIKDSLIRYSVGIEDADDLIADLEEALRNV